MKKYVVCAGIAVFTLSVSTLLAMDEEQTGLLSAFEQDADEGEAISHSQSRRRYQAPPNTPRDRLFTTRELTEALQALGAQKDASNMPDIDFSELSTQGLFDQTFGNMQLVLTYAAQPATGRLLATPGTQTIAGSINHLTTNTSLTFEFMLPSDQDDAAHGHCSTQATTPLRLGSNQLPLNPEIKFRFTGEKIFQLEWQAAGRSYNVESSEASHHESSPSIAFFLQVLPQLNAWLLDGLHT